MWRNCNKGGGVGRWSLVTGFRRILTSDQPTATSHSARSAPGFTLIEVMIAVTILAGMALAMFGATTQILNTKDRVEERDESNHSVSFAMNRMAEDLNSAYIVKSADMLGTKFEGEVAFKGKEDRLDFVNFNHLRFIQGAQESDSMEVGYYLAPDPDDPDLRILMRRESANVDKDPETGGQAFPLLSGVKNMRFQYLPSDSDEFKAVWDTTSIEAGGKLPRAVKVELEVRLPQEEEIRTFTTLAPIQMKEPVVF
jgi:type II secretion system protein J